METKQISNDYKPTTDQNSLKRLTYIVRSLEAKLTSVKLVHDKLHELISVVSKTHENIVDELSNIKTVLNEIIIEQEEDEIIPIDGTKSEWDDDDDDDDEEFQSKKSNKTVHRKSSPLIRRTDRLILNSASSNDSSTSKRSSNLKKSDRSSSRTKSPKSVTFSLDNESHHHHQQQQQQQEQRQEKLVRGSIQQLSNNTKNESFDDRKVPIMSCSNSDTSKENQYALTSFIDKIIPNIRIHEIESRNGDYLRLLNLSNSDDYDLSGHCLQQTIASKVLCRFRFPFNTIIRAGHTVTVWCGPLKSIIPQPPHVFLWKEQRKWETEPECITTLVKPNGQPIAWFRNSLHINTDQSSSDILFVHSKSSTVSSDLSSNATSSLKRQSRLTKFNIIGNNKPPFAHPPNSSIHPNQSGVTFNNTKDCRIQANQKIGISHLLNRPKSTPFASHTGCKQDILSRNILKTQQNQQQNQPTIKT